MAFSVQSRSEFNGLQNHKTFREALIAASKDQTIWKISFNIQDGDRIRLVKNEQGKFEVRQMSDEVNDLLAKELLQV